MRCIHTWSPGHLSFEQHCIQQAASPQLVHAVPGVSCRPLRDSSRPWLLAVFGQQLTLPHLQAARLQGFHRLLQEPQGELQQQRCCLSQYHQLGRQVLAGIPVRGEPQGCW